MTKLPQWTSFVHHDSSELFLSDTAPRIGDTIMVKLRVPRHAELRALYLRSRPDGEWRRISMAIAASDSYYHWWEAPLPIVMRHNNYCFHFLADKGSFYLNQMGISPIDSPDWFNFTVLGDYNAPLWVRDQIFYQIFPERFANGDPTNDRQTGEPTLMGKPALQRELGRIAASL